MSDEFKFLLEKYAADKSKMDVISGLLIAQIICQRKLIEHHDSGLLEVMGSISAAIDEIKESN